MTMTDPPKRRPGRPRLDPSGQLAPSVHLKLLAADYDAAAKVAAGRRESIQDVIRRGLRHELDTNHKRTM
jgi:hypothetical protein